MIRLYRIIKRAADFFSALIFLAIFSPVLLLLSLCLWASAGKPIVFTSKRIGKNKKVFRAYKFRTLVNGLKRRKDGLSKKIPSNGLAAFIRVTHIDETLQLFNVLKGEMSFIGPRPLDVPRYYYLKGKDNTWDSIFKIRPGMTCINQVAKYSDWGMDKIRELKGLRNVEKRNRLMLDKYYIKHESHLLDLKITLWTIEYLVGGFFKKLFMKEEEN